MSEIDKFVLDHKLEILAHPVIRTEIGRLAKKKAAQIAAGRGVYRPKLTKQ